MISWLKRFDDGVARGEAAIAAFVLLSMIILAASQAILYNLATKAGLEAATEVLLHLDWIDAFLQKGTLWLAFLGASLATHDDKHIAVDVMSRVLPGRARLVAKSLISFASGVACFFLGRAFYIATFRAQDRPLEYEVLTDSGGVHICEASTSLIAEYELARPDLFCSFRWSLEQLGVRATEIDGSILQVETPVGALQLIVPALFLWMAIRFGARTIGTGLAAARGDIPPGPGPRDAGSDRALSIDDEDASDEGEDGDGEEGVPPVRETKKMARVPRGDEDGPSAKKRKSGGGKKRKRRKKKRR